jgi:hypothetical protein
MPASTGNFPLLWLGQFQPFFASQAAWLLRGANCSERHANAVCTHTAVRNAVVFAGLNDFVRTIYIRGTKKVFEREISFLKLKILY